MKIYRALRTNIITQKFGENLNSFYKQLGMLGHNGLDWGAKDGEPLYWDCSIRGVVLNTEIDSSGGLGINIITDEQEGIFKHRFWHLKGFNVIAGQSVETSDLIGWADNTGMSTGTHLHRDLKPMIKDELGNYKIKDRDNGYFGCIDYGIINIFVVDYMNILKTQLSLLQKIIIAMKSLIKIFKGQ